VSSRENATRTVPVSSSARSPRLQKLQTFPVTCGYGPGRCDPSRRRAVCRQGLIIESPAPGRPGTVPMRESGIVEGNDPAPYQPNEWGELAAG
jgi:hypothetical protein